MSFPAPDGPDWQKLFDVGILQPKIFAEHYEMVLRFLNFLKGTVGYEKLRDMYIEKGFKHPDHMKPVVVPAASKEEVMKANPITPLKKI